MQENMVVKIHDVNIDKEYSLWLGELKARYRSAQAKAAVRINAEQLLFNWELGRDLVVKKAEQRWGAGVVEQVSLDLQAAFPESKGFSVSNLWRMKQWYLFYRGSAETLAQLGREMPKQKLQQAVRELQSTEDESDIKLAQPGREMEFHQAGGELGMPFPAIFAYVPWKHHVEIVTKSKSIDEAMFYIRETIEKGLSRPALLNCIKAKLYEHKGKILNNFSEHLPTLQSELIQEVLKENYDFGFATVSHEVYDERELEDALSRSVTDLLLELGTGFAFLGRQRELITGDNSRKIDLLFYHIRLRCYIVCELKARPFEPEYAGKLNFYVNAVDDLLKQDDDNPTIGLLICSDMNRRTKQEQRPNLFGLCLARRRKTKLTKPMFSGRFVA